MRYCHTTLFAANLLAYLEAIIMGRIDGADEERQRASRFVARVAQIEYRKWRIHRRPSPGRSRSLRRLLVVVGMTLCSLAVPAEAGVCPGEAPGCGWSRCGTPARPALSFLWGQELRPAETAIPSARDSTDFNEFFAHYGVDHPQFMDLDIRDHYLFAALAWGLEVWDLTTQPASPQRLAVVSGPTAFRQWSPNPEIKRPIRHLAAASSDLIVLGGQEGVGFLAFDTRVKAAPLPLYQDARSDVYEVATATGNGRILGLAAAGSELRMYDLSAATRLTRCLEGLDFCGSVFLGRLGSAPAASVAASGRWIVYGGAGGYELWDVGLSQPRRIFAGLSAAPVLGLALWQDGSSLYLAVHTGLDVRIYDASCALTGSCTDLSLLWSKPILDFGGSEHLLTFSRSGSTAFLYAGSDNYCAGGLQREWLWDVSNPRQPRDVSPQPVGSGSFAQSYWGWYYHGNASGFNNLDPRVAVFDGPYLYRAALSVLDIHRWAPAPVKPTASFTYSPFPPAPGQAVQFQSTATQSPTSFSWSFAGAVPSFMSGPTVVTRWTRPGLKKVFHTACNRAGCGTVSMDVGVATFADVPPSYWAWPSIEAAAMARLATGCAPAKFCPDLKVTRADFAVFLVRARHGASYVPPAPAGVFTDVPSSYWAAAFIEQFYRDGFTSGCGPRLFCPDSLLTRAEMAVFLEKAKRGVSFVPPTPTGVFADVPATYWAAGYIEQLYRDGITSGCGDSPRVFCPSANVTRAEAAVFLTRTFHLPLP